MRNPYFRYEVKSEQNLYEDIIIESLKIYGQDVYYLPRDIINEDKILGEDVPSRFNSSYKIEMYIENTEGFDGEGDLFTRFGIEIRDQASFVVSRRRWDSVVRSYDNDINAPRPSEGDLLYIPFSRKLFQIMHVEHEQPFYQLTNLPTYKLRCELFEYNDQNFDTGVEEIDDIEAQNAYEYLLTLDSASAGYVIGENVSQTLSDGTIISGEVSRWSDSDNLLGLIHVGADDGQFHTFVTGSNVTTDNSTSSVVSVTETGTLVNQSNESNQYYDDLVNFLDFSESNPFGDPE